MTISLNRNKVEDTFDIRMKKTEIKWQFIILSDED